MNPTRRPCGRLGSARQCVFEFGLGAARFRRTWRTGVRGQPLLARSTKPPRLTLREQRAGGNFGELQPGFEGGGLGRCRSPAPRGMQISAPSPCASVLGALDEQLQAVPGPGHVFNIQPDEFGTAQCAREVEQKHCLIAGASEIWSAGSGTACGPRLRIWRQLAATDCHACARCPGASLGSQDAWCRGDGRRRHTHGLWRQRDGAGSASHVTFTSRRQIGPHHLGCRRYGDEPVPVAPGPCSSQGRSHRPAALPGHPRRPGRLAIWRAQLPRAAGGLATAQVRKLVTPARLGE